jgi:signal transduction histidine kinase
VTLYDRIERYLGIAGIVLAMSLLAALLVSAVFQRAVAKPIRHLAEVAETVSREKQYSVRADATRSNDEIAVLIRAFNDMLGQIQERDSALQQARDGLETRVKERTAELQQAEDTLRNLSGRLLTLQDQERRSIARELHDSTGQVLAALSLQLAMVQMEADKLSASAAKAVDDSINMVTEMSRELRTLSYLLHPPLLDEAGLESALRWYVQGFSDRSGIRAELEFSEDFGRQPEDIETAVFRIVQESLTNVHRHSGSATAHVRLIREQDSVRVEVNDRGKGMTVETRSKRAELGIGIQGMKERVSQLGGHFEIQSDTNGTTVIASFDCPPLQESTSRSSSESFNSSLRKSRK